GGTYTSQAASTLFAIGSSTAGTATSTFLTVTSSGNVGIGTANPTGYFQASVTNQPKLQIAAIDATAALSVTRYGNNANPGRLVFQKSRGATVDSFAALQSGDTLGQIYFGGSANSTEASSTAALIAG